MFRVGPVYCCAPSFPVESIIQPPEMTRTPGSNTAHPGLFKHAGNMVSGLDLRYQFGVDEQGWTKPGRIIIAGVDAGVIGFWVDQIVEVMQMPQTGWGSLPPLLPRGVFTRTLLFNDKIFLYAEFEKLFSIPTSGYLRIYIEHLIEVEQQAQQKSAVGQSSVLSGTNFNTNKGSSTTKSTSKTPDTKPNNGTKSKTSKNNVHPIRDEKTTKISEPVTKTITTASNFANPIKTGQSSALDPEKSENVETLDKKESNKDLRLDANQNKKSSLIQESKSALRNYQAGTVKPAANKTVSKTFSENNKNTRTESSVTKPPTTTNRISKQTVPSNVPPIVPSNYKKTNLPTSAHGKQEKYTCREEHTNKVSDTVTKPLNKTVPRSETLNTSFEQNIKEPNKVTQTETINHDDETSIWPMILIMLLVVSIGTGAYWYVTQESDKKTHIVSAYDKIELNPPTANGLSNNEVTESTIIGESTVEETSIVSNFEPEIKEPTTNTITDTPVQVTEDNIEHEPNDSKPDEQLSQVTTDETDYKADIVQNQDGITIILDTPDDEPVFKTSAQDEVSLEPPQAEATTTESKNVVADSNDKSETNTTETDTNEANTMELASGPKQTQDSVEIELIETSEKTAATSTQIREIEPAVRQQMTEIIHIVKKGDTLWHIAIRYVNNPYRYPELARLSNIQNPDLIYPGNRVRIIKRHRIKE